MCKYMCGGGGERGREGGGKRRFVLIIQESINDETINRSVLQTEVNICTN